jgi:hypothetical protein
VVSRLDCAACRSMCIICENFRGRVKAARNVGLMPIHGFNPRTNTAAIHVVQHDIMQGEQRSYCPPLHACPCPCMHLTSMRVMMSITEHFLYLATRRLFHWILPLSFCAPLVQLACSARLSKSKLWRNSYQTCACCHVTTCVHVVCVVCEHLHVCS